MLLPYRAMLLLLLLTACNQRPSAPQVQTPLDKNKLDSLPKDQRPTQDESDAGTDKTSDDEMSSDDKSVQNEKPLPMDEESKPSQQPIPEQPKPVVCANYNAEQAFQGYVTINSGGKSRKVFLVIPSNYNPRVPMPVVFGFHGRDYDGIRMRDYLDLEKQGEWALFVYPDALSRTWNGNVSIGWQNGPLGGIYGGGEDLVFVDDIIAYMKKRFCTDTKRYFATGQSWGGDFTNVVGCFKGSSFRAILPVAANGAYYLPKDPKSSVCTGSPAAWPMHSKTDEYFAVPLGEEYRDFWLKRNSCTQQKTKLPIDDDCFEYQGCAQSTRWCLYTGNHQVPRTYYSSEAVKYFRSFIDK